VANSMESICSAGKQAGEANGNWAGVHMSVRWITST
jgi:hypothetical protein